MCFVCGGGETFDMYGARSQVGVFQIMHERNLIQIFPNMTAILQILLMLPLTCCGGV